MDIKDIIESIQAGRVRISEHADEEAAEEAIRLDDIYYSVVQGEIIEDYSADKPFPSCLILGLAVDGRPVHSVWARNDQTRWVVPITVYRPDPRRWVGWRERRKGDDAI